MHTPSRSRSRRGIRTLLVAAAVAVVLPFSIAACSSQPSASSSAGTASGVGAKWGSCMRDAGFDVQDPDDASVEAGFSNPPAGADDEEYGRASSTCSEQAGVERASTADHQKWERQYAQVATCIRENGYEDLPEQEPGTIQTDGYPRAEEPGFNDVFMDCLAEFAPDTKTQGVG